MRRKPDVIRAIKPPRTLDVNKGVASSHPTVPIVSAPVTKSAYAPPANTIFQPNVSFFSTLSLFSPTRSTISITESYRPLSTSTIASKAPSTPSATKEEPGTAGVSLLDQNNKRKVGDRIKSSRTGLSIFEKTFIKKRKLGLDTDSR